MSTTAPSGAKHDVRLGPGGRKLAATLLVMVSALLGLLLCEIGLRLFNRYEAGRPGSLSRPEAIKPAASGDALRYVARLPVAPGTDRRWFTEDPPPLPNRSQPTAQQLERFNDFRKHGIFAAQADYIWNRYYVESERCAVNGTFQNYPQPVLAFNPTAKSFHPRFRFPSNATTVAGLVTNEFGFRGHPVSLVKPPKTIRIAFAGASTTVGFHHFAFSYPEYVEAWLNRFAQANHLNVRFEALNAGREGLTSEDMAAIVRDELLPLDPDLVIYYEGSNQFRSARLLALPTVPPKLEIDTVIEHKIPKPVRDRLATANLLDRALSGFGNLAEPRKPAYHLNWPAGVDQRNPDVDNPNLPLQLPTIVKDLDSIRASLASIQSQLVLCSFEWLANDRMALSPARHEFIYKQLNTELWPLRYADIRRLADFQNRVFRRYAAARNIAFLDVASSIPQDPGLFVDAIHMTEAGDRVRAWIAFQKLAPLLRAEIESGQLPRPSGSRELPPPPSQAASEMSVHCPSTPTGPLQRLPGALSLDMIEPSSEGASVRHGPPVQVVTAGALFSYAASISINAPTGLARPCYLYLRGRVVSGQIGVGALDRESKDLQLEKTIDPSPKTIDIYVPVLFPDRATALLIRNMAPGGIRSTMLIEDAGLLVFQKPLPEELIRTVSLDEVRLANAAATMERRSDGLLVTTARGMGAFAARVPLGLAKGGAESLSVHVWLRVLEGKAGVGILTADGKQFIEEHPAPPLSRVLEVILPLLPPHTAGDLIVRNIAVGNVVSKAVVQKIEIRRAP